MMFALEIFNIHGILPLDFRAQKPLSKLLELIENYPHSDPQNPKLQTGLEEIRAKFKQVSINLCLINTLYLR